MPDARCSAAYKVDMTLGLFSSSPIDTTSDVHTACDAYPVKFWQDSRYRLTHSMVLAQVAIGICRYWFLPNLVGGEHCVLNKGGS